ncbi:MAG: MAPEG family protein [Thiobacillus sp.]|nr:MAPEG family protein [Thiobacillus sp.]
MPHDILLPCAAMVALTGLVWLRAVYERVAESRARGIAPQSLASSRDIARILKNTQALDNFTNLFEFPVLFYVPSLAMVATGMDTAGYVIGAWVFVALRAAHSLIHVTYNRVFHHFVAWMLGAAWLFAMWGSFVFELITHRA